MTRDFAFVVAARSRPATSSRAAQGGRAPAHRRRSTCSTSTRAQGIDAGQEVRRHRGHAAADREDADRRGDRGGVAEDRRRGGEEDGRGVARVTSPSGGFCERGGICRHGRLQRRGMDRRNPARGIDPGRGPGADPGLEKGEEGTPEKILGRPACGVPAVLSPRPHRTGRFQPPRPPLFGDPLRGRPLRDDLRGAFSALWARPARSGRGADVFGPSRPAPRRRLREKPCSRSGRPSRTPPSARRGTASPPPA